MLLGFLATMILTLYAEIERELESQLAKNSIYRVFTNELVSSQKADTLLVRIYEEELMWSARYGEENVIHLQQPLLSATWKKDQSVPIIVYGSSLAEFRSDNSLVEPAKIWFLSKGDLNLRPVERISILDRNTVAYPAEIPDWVAYNLSIDKAIAIPLEFMEASLKKGFINYSIANLSSLDEVEDYIKQVVAYHSAEGRKIKISSSLEIIRNLEKIRKFQRLARAGVLIGCGVILACTLGSIAWLEYRQEAYLLALLRSFGTPRIILQLHAFFENFLLVFVGLSLSLLLWKVLYRSSDLFLKDLGFEKTGSLALPVYDISIIMLAGIIGVLLSMIPITFGLRKPIGLILQ